MPATRMQGLRIYRKVVIMTPKPKQPSKCRVPRPDDVRRALARMEQDRVNLNDASMRCPNIPMANNMRGRAGQIERCIQILREECRL